MASTYLTRATANFGTATNRKKCTISFWLKRSALGVQQAVMGVETTPAGGSNEARIVLRTDDTLEFYDYQSTYKFRYITNRKFRDTSSWYHIVLAIDTTHPTGSARVNIYINGVQETSFSTSTDPAQNLDTFLNSGAYIQIGRQSTGNSYLNGSLSHYHFIDGTTYNASAFGETDTTTGEWEAKTSPSVNYGTNGFLILKDGNTITDQSSNSNAFTLGGGTLTDLKDNPDNNFATMNPLFAGDANITYSNGNLKTTAANDSQKNAVSSIAVSSGKWYCEMVSRNGTNYPGFGIMDSQSVLQTSVSYLGSSSDSYCMFQDGNYYTNGSASSTGTTWGVGSIMGVAIDLDSSTKTIKFYKNGSQTHSATIATPANAYVFAVSHNTNGTITEINFGNGFFGTTAITTNSGNGYSGAEGSSKFNYTVPTGYSALSTKGLNE